MKQGNHKKATFPAQLDKLHDMLMWVRHQLQLGLFQRNDLRKIEIASEEALVNIIRHAYQNRKGVVKIYVHFLQPNEVQIRIEDQGPPFNPLNEEIKLDKLAPLEERNEGGLGILLIRQYMDQVQYRRKGVYNQLTLIKKAECA